MDVQVRNQITGALRARGVEVITAQEVESDELPDPDLLDEAGGQGRILFTNDEDFLAEAVRRQRIGEGFSGVIYAHQLRITIGQCIDDLELICKVYDPEDVVNRIIYLPLR